MESQISTVWALPPPEDSTCAENWLLKVPAEATVNLDPSTTVTPLERVVVLALIEYATVVEDAVWDESEIKDPTKLPEDKFADFTLELDSDIDYFLSYLESINFNNFDFLNRKENLKGQANIYTRIQFPIPMESYKDFEIDVDMQIEDGRYLLSEEDSLIIPIVNIDFRNNIIKSNGELNYKGIPSQFTTTTSLDSQLTTQIELSTSVSPTEINILAPYLGEYVGGFGRVPADIIISTSLNDFSPEQAVIKADLTDIILQYSGFNWQKNINDRAELTLIMN